MSCKESYESKSELIVPSDNSDKNFIPGYVIENSEGNDNLSDNYSDFEFKAWMVGKTQIRSHLFKALENYHSFDSANY